MCARKGSFQYLPFFLFALVLVLAATPEVVYADEGILAPDQGKCMTCHENLYYLHDTGKWYCLQGTPMACVDCHGGDPTAVTQEKAHAFRAAHPVINGEVAKCQECHPGQCAERVQIFKDVAGISPVVIAAAYVPVAAVAQAPVVPVTGQEQWPVTVYWQKSLSIVILAALVLAVFRVSKSRNKVKR